VSMHMMWMHAVCKDVYMKQPQSEPPDVMHIFYCLSLPYYPQRLHYLVSIKHCRTAHPRMRNSPLEQKQNASNLGSYRC